MPIELIFLSVCVGGLIIFLLSLIVSTMIMDTRLFMNYQYLLSSLKFSKETDERLNFILSKYDAGLLTAKLNNNCIEFNENGTYNSYAKIWVGNKYYSYGFIHSLNGYSEHSKTRGKLSTFKKIVQLEDTLSGRITKKEEPNKHTKKDDSVILS